MSKTYNTPKRSHIIKTRLDDEEYSEFLRRLELYGMNQSEFLRQAITGASVRPIITVHPVNDELLSALGKMAADELQRLEQIYPGVRVHKITVMPDHIHLLVSLGEGRPQVAPTPSVPRLMQQFKGKLTKLAGRPIWQKSYYDHVIRDENDFLTKWNYMEHNPGKWVETHLP